MGFGDRARVTYAQRMEKRRAKRRHLIFYFAAQNNESGAALGHVADITPDGMLVIGDSVLEVGPGEDQELDAIVRAAADLALAHAEELAGAFNNLPLEERERRTRRILELRAATRNAAVAAELSELGEHEYLELVPERLAMEVRAYVRDWTWGGRR